MVNISLIAGWVGRCLQDAQQRWRHKMVLPGGIARYWALGISLPHRTFPTAQGTPTALSP